MRGGYPLLFEKTKEPTVDTNSAIDTGDVKNFDIDVSGRKDAIEPEDKHVVYIYSRVHGDIERDYNFFQVSSTYFSQGPGNYRDVAQNRRNDVTSYQILRVYKSYQTLVYIRSYQM